MNILLLASHAVAEYDDVRMFTHLGYDVFSPGGYEDPSKLVEGIRPQIPGQPDHPELRQLCDLVRQEHDADGDDTSYAIDWAKNDLHHDLVDWADAIIVHHFPERWIAGQWGRLKSKRIIWRTCGQSNPSLEQYMSRFKPQLQIVRYSPAEERAFKSEGLWAGQDALIRFGKFTDDYARSDGSFAAVGNVSQWQSHEGPLGRGKALGLAWYKAATEEVATAPAGPGSEALPGGFGILPHAQLLAYLSTLRAYIYTGTQPASYTLALIEAMMSGLPVLSIGPRSWGWQPLFEGHELAYAFTEDPNIARLSLRQWLEAWDDVRSAEIRDQAVRLFGMETIGRQWVDFLGTP